MTGNLSWCNPYKNWPHVYQYEPTDMGKGAAKLTPEQDEIRKLKAQVKQLELEKKILKEATVFFAKETK